MEAAFAGALPRSHLALSLAAASLTTLSPCIFHLLPLVVGGAVQANRLAPVAMGVAMAASFALIGFVLGALGPALGIDQDSVRIFGALMLIGFAAVMLVPAINERFTQWGMPIASSANNASGKLDSGSPGGAFLLGALIGLTGIAILSGADKWLEAQVVAVLPDAWVNLTTRF